MLILCFDEQNRVEQLEFNLLISSVIIKLIVTVSYMVCNGIDLCRNSTLNWTGNMNSITGF